MSWTTDLTAARERLATLEAAELAALNPNRVEQVGAGGETMKYAAAPNLADIRRSIAECRQIIRRLEGRGGGGAIIPVLG